MSSLDEKTTYLFTSLTSGSSHIFDSTLRLQHILQTRKIPFVALDIATDDAARRIWVNRSGPARKLPGVVKGGVVIGDWTEIEEWVENGLVTEKLGGLRVTGFMGAKPQGGSGQGAEEKGAPEKTKVKVMETKEVPKPEIAPLAPKKDGLGNIAAEAAIKAKEMRLAKLRRENAEAKASLEAKALAEKTEKLDITEEKKTEGEDQKKPEVKEEEKIKEAEATEEETSKQAEAKGEEAEKSGQTETGKGDPKTDEKEPVASVTEPKADEKEAKAAEKNPEVEEKTPDVEEKPVEAAEAKKEDPDEAKKPSTE